MNKEVKCWICGKTADSREHIIKKTDLVRAYGSGSFSPERRPAHVKDGKIRNLQGPDSMHVKYQPSLCQGCNGAFSQPFDLAYDLFIDWVLQNEESVLRYRFIDFQDVYGNDFEGSQRNLFKYFVKSFGCRLVDTDKSVPPDLITLLGQERFLTAIRLNFSVHEDILLMPRDSQDGFIGKGDLLSWKINPSVNAGVGYSFNEHVSWFYIHYWYGVIPEPRTGSEWMANSRVVYVGSFTSLAPKQRDEMIEKIRTKPSGTCDHNKV